MEVRATKLCSKCKKRKPESEFHKNKRAPDGLSSWCKTCAKVYSTKYYAVHRKEAREQRRKHQKAHPEKVKERSRKYQKAHPRKIKAINRKWHNAHPEVRRAAGLKHCREHPEKVREAQHKHRLKRKYGLTPEDYDRMLEVQGGVCAVCGEPEQALRRLAVDHDHVIGKVRGLVCTHCNVAMGMLDDSPTKAQKVVDYLRTHLLKRSRHKRK